MSEEDFAAAFGYRAGDARVTHQPFSVQVAEGKNSATLEPLIVLSVRYEEGSEQEAFLLPLDMAEGLARELIWFVAVARNKHWDPGHSPGHEA